MTRKGFSARLPERSHALLYAIAQQTGMTLTQVLIQAIECLAERYNVPVPD